MSKRDKTDATIAVPKSVQELRDAEKKDIATMPEANDGGGGEQMLNNIINDPTFGLMNPTVFEHLYRVATALARSQLVPKIFQGKPEDCFIATQMALALHCQPMTVLQNMFVVYGTPGFSAKFCIALANQNGPFDGVIQFKTIGEAGKENFGVTAYARVRKTGQPVERTVTMAIAKAEGWAKNNPKYASMPEQMLSYRAATWLIRLYCPEVLFGMPTTEEIYDTGGHYIDAEIVGRDEPSTTPALGTKADQPKEELPDGEEQEQEPEPAPNPAPAPEKRTGKPEKTAHKKDKSDTNPQGMTFEEAMSIINSANPDIEDDLDICRDLARAFPLKQRAELNEIIAQKFVKHHANKLGGQANLIE